MPNEPTEKEITSLANEPLLECEVQTNGRQEWQLVDTLSGYAVDVKHIGSVVCIGNTSIELSDVFLLSLNVRLIFTSRR